jgi:hypothetical protein
MDRWQPGIWPFTASKPASAWFLSVVFVRPQRTILSTEDLFAHWPINCARTVLWPIEAGVQADCGLTT